MLASSARVRAPYFRSKLATWYFTVLAVIPSWSPMRWFEIPVATRRSTCFSRSVSSSAPSTVSAALGGSSGISIRSVVPQPGVVSTSMVPSSAATRSTIGRSVSSCAVTAIPPSSRTSISRLRPSQSQPIRARAASARSMSESTAVREMARASRATGPGSARPRSGGSANWTCSGPERIRGRSSVRRRENASATGSSTLSCSSWTERARMSAEEAISVASLRAAASASRPERSTARIDSRVIAC